MPYAFYGMFLNAETDFFQLKQLQQIDQYGKAEQKYEAHGVDDRFDLAVDGLAAHPFDGGKDDFRAVERGNGQEVEHGEIDADVCGDL